MSSGACDPVAAELIPVYQNVGQVIIQTELQQTVTGRGMRPSVFVAVVYYQAARFGCCLESFIVVSVSSGTILYSIDVSGIMNHFVKESCHDFLYIPPKGSSSDVDFMCSTQLGNPCIFPEGEVAVCLGG